MVTAGGVVSLKTVTVTGSEVTITPRAFRALARSVCGPFAEVFVFHAVEYGDVVSSGPRLTPSS
jgi:hypothetical protein